MDFCEIEGKVFFLRNHIPYLEHFAEMAHLKGKCEMETYWKQRIEECSEELEKLEIILEEME